MLLGDREFIGKTWLDWLESEQIPYVFRLKENGQYMSNSRGKMVKISDLLHDLRNAEAINLGIRKVGKLDKQPYHVSALRNKKGELVVVICGKTIQNPLEIYKIRWEIETMFKAFKSAGFNMESTHIIDYERLNTLFGVLAIAFCIAYKAGIITAQTEPIPIKTHGRKAQSVLRKGLDALQNLLKNLHLKYNKFKFLLAKILEVGYVPIRQNEKIVLY